jgi:tetratricopeptide (TPR) repeat protein
MEVQRTLELDPLSFVMNSSGAFIYLLARRYEEAIERSLRTIELHPNHALPHLWLGWAYSETGRFDVAIGQHKNAVAISGGAARFLSGLGHGYAVAGKTAEAPKALAELQRMARTGYVSAYDFAVIHAGLHDKENVFSCFEKAYNERSTWLCLLRGDSRFDPFRTDPRFQQFLSRLGLAP